MFVNKALIIAVNWIVSGSDRVRYGQSSVRVAEKIRPAEIFLGRPSTLSAAAEGPPIYRYDSIGPCWRLYGQQG